MNLQRFLGDVRRWQGLQPMLITLGVGTISFVIGVELGRISQPAQEASERRPTPQQHASAPRLDPQPANAEVVEPVRLFERVTPDQVTRPEAPTAQAPATPPQAPVAEAPEAPGAGITPAPDAPEPVQVADLPPLSPQAEPAAPAAPAPDRPTVPGPGAAAPAPGQSRAEQRTQAATPAPEEPESAAAAEEQEWAIQVASLRDRNLASEQAGILSARGLPVFIETAELGDQGTWYRVLAGTYATKAEAERVLAKLHEDSRFTASFVRSY